MERTASFPTDTHPLGKAWSNLRPYEYSPLDTSVDSIRLLILGPAESFLNSPIYCRIQHVTFAQKPKYEALSYTWGDETIRHNIAINGQKFTVGRNLFDALRHLQHRSEERVFWVDAICINQSDVAEKNQQIGIMPFIYMQAKTVLVWLGLPDENARTIFQKEDSIWEESIVKKGKFVPDKPRLLEILCNNPYWRRVWIIQEVGLARKLFVCYGAYTVEWASLIEGFRSSSETQNSLPIKLQKQLDDKYENGHKLQALIESYRDSLCKEPRDHIYGFVGLAVDCQEGFPVDYGKSLYEVWKDVIRFKNASQPGQGPYTEPDIDILCFGRIVQELLGGPGIATAEEVARDIHPPPEVQHADILIPARVSGRIVHLGPSYQEVMSSLKAMASWRASINRYLLSQAQPSAREESDLFLELLEEVEDEDLKIVESFDREISVAKPQTPDCLLYADQQCHDRGLEEDVLIASPADSKPASTHPRLFLLGGVADWGDTSPGKLGLAPSETRGGDYVCQVHGIEKALVVRKEVDKVTVIGSAAAAENRFVARDVKERCAKNGKMFGTTHVKFINSGNRLDLYVDIATAYQLMG